MKIAKLAWVVLTLIIETGLIIFSAYNGVLLKEYAHASFTLCIVILLETIRNGCNL
jgi:hypothetical protein